MSYSSNIVPVLSQPHLQIFIPMKGNSAFPAKWKGSSLRENPHDNPTCAPCFQAELWLIWLWLYRFMPVLLTLRWKFFCKGSEVASWNNSNISWKVQPPLAALDICLCVCFYTARVCQSKWKPCSLAAAFINSPAYLLSMFISFVGSIHLVEACTVRGFMCSLGIMGSLLELWHHVGFPQQTRNP